jgi:hypothetical protein
MKCYEINCFPTSHLRKWILHRICSYFHIQRKNLEQGSFLLSDRNMKTWKVSFSKSRSSPVGIATGYGLTDRGVGVRIPVESRICISPPSSRLSSTQHPIQWVLLALSVGIKRPVREADQSPPTSSDIKKSLDLYNHSPTRIVVNYLSTGTALSLKNGVFWDVTPCGSGKNRRLGGT